MNSEHNIVFDTDILSSFSGINKLDDLNNLFKNRIIIPDVVVQELAPLKLRKSQKYIYDNIVNKIGSSDFKVFNFVAGTPEYETYIRLISGGKLGKGEAACIAIATNNDKIISSSNFKDIGEFVRSKQVDNIPTLEILKKFHTDLGYTPDQVNQFKDDLVKMGRTLPKGPVIPT